MASYRPRLPVWNRNRMMKVLAIAIVALGAAPHAVVAQAATVTDSGMGAQACASGSPYVDCALWFDGPRLRRGIDGSMIARTRLWRPMRLAPHLAGDSASAHGRMHDRDIQRSGAMAFAGSLFLVGSMTVLGSYHCRPEPSLGYCTTRDDEYVFAAVGLSSIGTLLTLASFHFALRAQREGARAIWWHNAAFGR